MNPLIAIVIVVLVLGVTAFVILWSAASGASQ